MFKILGLYFSRLTEYLFEIMTILVVYAGYCLMFWFLFLKTDNQLGQNIATGFIFMGMFVAAGKIAQQAKLKKSSTNLVQFMKVIVIALSVLILFLFTKVAIYQANSLF